MRLISILFFAIFSLQAFAETEVTNCKLKRVGTRDNHKGEEQLNAKNKIFVFSNKPQMMLIISPEDFEKKIQSKNWPIELGEEYNKILLEKRAKNKEKDSELKRNSVIEINGPEFSKDKIFYEEIWSLAYEASLDPHSWAVRTTYNRQNQSLVVNSGPGRMSPTIRSYYECQKILSMNE